MIFSIFLNFRDNRVLSFGTLRSCTFWLLRGRKVWAVLVLCSLPCRSRSGTWDNLLNISLSWYAHCLLKNHVCTAVALHFSLSLNFTFMGNHFWLLIVWWFTEFPTATSINYWCFMMFSFRLVLFHGRRFFHCAAGSDVTTRYTNFRNNIVIWIRWNFRLKFFLWNNFLIGWGFFLVASSSLGSLRNFRSFFN